MTLLLIVNQFGMAVKLWDNFVDNVRKFLVVDSYKSFQKNKNKKHEAMLIERDIVLRIQLSMIPKQFHEY